MNTLCEQFEAEMKIEALKAWISWYCPRRKPMPIYRPLSKDHRSPFRKEWERRGLR